MFRGRKLINKLLKVSLLQRVGEPSFQDSLFKFYKQIKISGQEGNLPLLSPIRMKNAQHALLLGKLMFLHFSTEFLDVIFIGYVI